MGNLRCRWVRDRLPLLAGDDLVGPDRRRVESHVVGCPECRRRRETLGQALLVLEDASASSPARPDAPSLWPDLARQIRESRRPHRGPTFGLGSGFGLRFPPPEMRLRPAFGLALGLFAAIGATVAVRNQIAATRADMAVNALPIAAPMRAPSFAERPRDLAPIQDPPTPVAENLPPQRFHDDIDPATGSAPDPRDSKPSY